MKETFERLVEHLLGSGFNLEEAVALLEKTLIERALERKKGNQSAASKMLGVHRNTLLRKMSKYELPGVRVRGKSAAREQARAPHAKAS